MRTNIDIDDELLAKAMAMAGTATKKATVEAGLKQLIRAKAYEGLRALRGKIEWEGDLDAMRRDPPVEPW
jgi:Arc/MetJ family transcription regulator